MRKLIGILNTMIARARNGMPATRYQMSDPRSASAERMHSLKTGERTGSRPTAAEGGGASASLEPGRSQVYFTQLLPGDEFLFVTVAKRIDGDLTRLGRFRLRKA